MAQKFKLQAAAFRDMSSKDFSQRRSERVDLRSPERYVEALL